MKLPLEIIRNRYKRKQLPSEIISNSEFNKLRIKTQELLNCNFKQAILSTRTQLNLSYNKRWLQQQVFFHNRQTQHDIEWIDGILDNTLDMLNSDNVWN